jgi:hypothetical protein
MKVYESDICYTNINIICDIDIGIGVDNSNNP